MDAALLARRNVDWRLAVVYRAPDRVRQNSVEIDARQVEAFACIQMQAYRRIVVEFVAIVTASKRIDMCMRRRVVRVARMLGKLRDHTRQPYATAFGIAQKAAAGCRRAARPRAPCASAYALTDFTSRNAGRTQRGYRQACAETGHA
ncbi:hypothetical protein [Paraburkholderia tropica]|uniref:hypothetical protein n=1 Tax=Paraburkholderia tropica TaxID=92647 RepID=UPI002AB26C40|nr:hypothetical protein [Paraburkholderia tropica]